MTPARILVTGRGSIAQRHVGHLRQLCPNAQIAVVSATGEVASRLEPCEVFVDADSAMRWKPDAVIIASISSKHAYEIELCIKFKLPCLAEKPLVICRAELSKLMAAAKLTAPHPAFVVGCNLRYLPALQKLASSLTSDPAVRVLRAQFEVGQDLTQWRPGRDLTTSYSADPARGGGVVFDLVHEIDIAGLLLGNLKVLAACGARLSDLPIKSSDVHIALLRTASGAPVVICLDYVSQQAVRRYAIVTTSGTYEVDILAKRIDLHRRQGSICISDIAADFDVAATYHSQMLDWLAALDNPVHGVRSSFDDGLKTAELMLAMNEAGIGS